MPSAPQSDVEYMRLAIRLAMRGRGLVEPNPMVGCMIVKDGRVIGEGWHERYGGPHAEPNALAACNESPAGATAYVTLEPCRHIGKKTPPCVPKLIEAKLARVVIGCIDPNPLVHGRGASELVDARIAVEVGVCEAEAKQLVAPFFARQQELRPYVTLKWAQTADAKIAGAGSARLQISNAVSSQAVHHLRAASDCILVGINTVLADDPMLTVRGVSAARPPMRAVLDTNLRIPPGSRLVATAAEAPLWVFCSHEAYRKKNDVVRRLAGHRVEVAALGTIADGTLSLWEFVRAVGRMGGALSATNLLVEAGPAIAQSFLGIGLADRVWVIESPKVVGEASAPHAPGIPADFIKTGETNLCGDRLTEYLNPHSPVFFAAQPSPDFVRTVACNIAMTT